MSSDEQLPTRHRMFHTASGEIKHAMDNLDSAAEWMRAEWKPVDSSLADTQADARAQFNELLAEVRTRLDKMRRTLDDAAGDHNQE